MGWFSSSSRLTGLVHIFNLMVGTGALALPAAFRKTGWLLSTFTLIGMSFISYLSYTFMFEVMAAANALIRHRGELVKQAWKGPGASSPPRQPRQLPLMIFETIINYKKWPKQLGIFQEKNILIFYQAKKLLKYTMSFLQNWKNGFIVLLSKKNSLNILDLFYRIEKQLC